MNQPRVFMICANQLVCEAVNVLLRREGIELLGIETDSDRALAQVRALAPDIVLIEGDAKGDVGLSAAMAQMVYEEENVRVIRLSLSDEQLHIYHQEQRRLINTQDLVTAIRTPLHQPA